MNVPSLQRKVEAADIAPERLAGNAQLTEAQKIGEATRQFEAILLRQILEDTQKPVIPSAYTDNSTAAGIYRDLVTNQLADSISKSGALGLGKSLEHEFMRRLPHTSAGDERKAAALPTARPNSVVARPLSGPAKTTHHPAPAASPVKEPLF